MKQFFSIFLAILLSFISSSVTGDKVDENNINLLIIHDKNSSNYLDVYQNFNQSLIGNLLVNSTTIDNIGNLDKYQIVYLDKSIIGKEGFKKNKKKLMSYVNSGGYLFLEDEFYNEFPKNFLGASQFKELGAFPISLKYPKVRGNLQGMQDVLKYFHKDVASIYDKKTLNKMKGHGFVPTTATPIAMSGNLALYGLNKYGNGYVFYANSFLPNDFYITGFDMARRNKNQEYFNFAFATGNYLFRNEFVSFVSKDIYGYSVKKVLGTYGRPAMAWQNHFEVASAVKNGSMEKWIDVLKDYNEIPSYSLARSMYEWGDWKESIVVHINEGTNKNLIYIGERENSHYSSGEHLLTDSGYVCIKDYPKYKSLASKLELPYRAYPDVADMNGDGILDIVSGSADGNIYLFLGREEGEGFSYEEKIKITNEHHNPINVGSYSSLVLYDINGDGLKDIIVGNNDGLIYSFINRGDLTFRLDRLLLKEKGLKNVCPTIGDFDGDGIVDLLVGDSKGNIYFHKGRKKKKTLVFNEKGRKLKAGKNFASVGSFASPRMYDIDGDGRLEVVVGNGEGYLRVYKKKPPYLIDKGYICGNTLNQFGNKRLWGGHYSVPCFADLNRDGKTDLVVGQVEFGLPIPIDSPMFPYEKELRSALKCAEENNIDIYPHVYYHNYKNHKQEMKEIELHKKAFEYYNIPWENVGCNQHTWRINSISPVQTFYSEMKEGIRWNSGYRPHMKAGEPSLSRDYLWTMPFFLSKGEGVEDFILFNPSPNIPIYEKMYDSISSLDLPITYFYHIEYPILKDKGLQDLRYKAEVLDRIRNEKDYNFMTETQMFNSFFSVMNSKIDTSYDYNGGDFILSFENVNKDPSQGIYKDTVGIEFEPGEKYAGYNFSTDANIYLRRGRNLYIGLGEKASIYVSDEKDCPHIVRANIPVSIKKHEENMVLNIEEGGLQQIKLYAPRGVEVLNHEFLVRKEEDYYTLTRYGEPTVLEIMFK